METWMAETASAKAITEPLQTTRDDNDFVCTIHEYMSVLLYQGESFATQDLNILY
jgi:hypothetical protein